MTSTIIVIQTDRDHAGLLRHSSDIKLLEGECTEHATLGLWVEITLKKIVGKLNIETIVFSEERKSVLL